ncbi:GNAT family N-acetyltransferase [Thermogemmatispora sp.]|uniref:GNAT family N-acetyltransferase n=1 Tax=Thermogemmatispora sp. TaxID=1968838 RepID=UPI001D4533D3|nr:GNAT family N-acetyltransferase [Thermogemmatispora sp.]MBX5448493.1 GNAT family N-acetyltransferase [Thermogemmatispora sp.]
MRVREARPGDLAQLWDLRQQAESLDGCLFSRAAWEDWQASLARGEPGPALFVLLDDDDDLNTWGQGGTLEGLEGELIGYTLLHLVRDAEGYHLRCEGTVHPRHRRRGGGRALLICALNRARLWGAELEVESQQQGYPLWFEVLLPQRDPAAPRLAARCELEAVAATTSAGQQAADDGLRLYRRLLL